MLYIQLYPEILNILYITTAELQLKPFTFDKDRTGVAAIYVKIF